MYRVEIKGNFATYTVYDNLTFDEACAKKERASKKSSFTGMKIKVIECH